MRALLPTELSRLAFESYFEFYFFNVFRAVNDKIMHHDAIVVKLATIEAEAGVLERENARLGSELTQEFNPNLIAYSLAVGRVLLNLKDAFVDQMKRLHESYTYQVSPTPTRSVLHLPSQSYTYQVSILHLPGQSYTYQVSILHLPGQYPTPTRSVLYLPGQSYTYQVSILHLPGQSYTYQVSILHLPGQSYTYQVSPTPTRSVLHLPGQSCTYHVSTLNLPGQSYTYQASPSPTRSVH